jgi:hypothetical protein
MSETKKRLRVYLSECTLAGGCGRRWKYVTAVDEEAMHETDRCVCGLSPKRVLTKEKW